MKHWSIVINLMLNKDANIKLNAQSAFIKSFCLVINIFLIRF